MAINYDVVSNHDKQPLHAFVEVYVAGHRLQSKYTSTGELTRSPEYIKSFEFNRINTGGTFILTLFDKNWDELLDVINAGFSSIDIRYGWVTGKVSPLYRCTAVSYSLDFKTAGVIISINGNVEGLSNSSAPTEISTTSNDSGASSTSPSLPNTELVTIDTGTSNPTEAVKAIAEAQGWLIGNYEPTKDIKLANEDSISMIKEYPIQYINQVLSKEAVSLNDVSGFRFYLDYSTEPPTSNFMPVALSLDSVNTYVYTKGINSSVIDLSLSVNGVFGGSGYSSTVTGVTSQTIDPNSKDITNSTTNTSAESTETDGNVYTGTPSNQSSVYSTAGMSADQSLSSMRYSMTPAGGSIPYTGNITILGDPNVNMADTVRLIVITSKGTYHDASGLYMITDLVADSIQEGKYITSMKVIKNVSAVGLEDVTGATYQTESTSTTVEYVPSYEPVTSSMISSARIFAPESNTDWIGHYDLCLKGSITIGGRVFKEPVFSYEPPGNLHIYDASSTSDHYKLYESKYKAYHKDFVVSSDSINSFLASLVSVMKGNIVQENGHDYVVSLSSSFSVYSVENNNCFNALAIWCNALGEHGLLDLYNSCNSYKDYLPGIIVRDHPELVSPYQL